MKRSSIRRISEKRKLQLQKEKILIGKLIIRCQGKCEECGQRPDWRGLSKHEIIKRSQGGNPLDLNNCKMLCGRCHSATEGIKEIKND